MKIRKLTINNYRAFLVHDDSEKELYTIELPAGENLLLYGENGSGKSSLFRAIKDFLISAINPGLPFSKNLFYKGENNTDQPFIRITLEDDTEYCFSSDAAATDTGSNAFIKQANITRGFISYRDLLKLHFREDNTPPDLFSFFLSGNGLLADETITAPIQPANRISYGLLWKKILEQKESQDIHDFNINAADKFASIEAQTNKLLGFFEDGFSNSIKYTACSLNDDQLTPPKISFKPNLFGQDISEHHDILNEARLTALSISVYLAHLLSLPPVDLQILFLDDIFIGLDMSNRLPLINILTSKDLGNGLSFSGFQIFLTTYDREWFEIAKTYLKEGWQKIEFYVDNRAQPQDRPFIRRTATYEERAMYHFMHGDYPACANYLRKDFESVFRKILPENMLYSDSYGSSGAEDSLIILPKNRLSMSENEGTWFFKTKDQSDSHTFSSRFINLQGLIGKFTALIKQYKIDFPEIKELELIKNRLLNPLSHDNLRSSVFKKELESGFTILKELKKINSFLLVPLQVGEETFLYLTVPHHLGNTYHYEIKLTENLRYISYGTTSRLLNAACEITSRNFTGGIKEEYPEICKSLQEACKKINQVSVFRGQGAVIADDSFVLDNVYAMENISLRQLI